MGTNELLASITAKRNFPVLTKDCKRIRLFVLTCIVFILSFELLLQRLEMAQEWRLASENVLFRIKQPNRITLFFEVAFYAWDLALKLHNLKKKELKLLNRYLTMKKTSI